MPLGDGIMHRAKPVAEKFSDDYFVIVKRVGRSKSTPTNALDVGNPASIKATRRQI